MLKFVLPLNNFNVNGIIIALNKESLVMEFNQKLQELRKRKGLTQEELGERLFVTRTAISKWESGRGYPNIDSLKSIAKFFEVTVDELLSGEEILEVAKQDNEQKQNSVKDLTFGLIDVSFIILFFLPIFAQTKNGTLYEVALINLTEIKLYLKIAYFVSLITIISLGVLTLTIQQFQGEIWLKLKRKFSLFLNVVNLVVFIASLQPYASVISLIFLIIKALTLIKSK